MSTIFPLSASVGQIFEGYEFNGTAWDIIGIDLTADYQPKITGVSDTEIEYLNGVTSAIQTQLNTKAPIDNPTFTGTVSGVSKSMVGLSNVDNTSDANKPVSTATQTALNAKANLANPTFTGTVTGITKSMVGLSNVDNTSDADKPTTAAVQNSLNAKANINSPTFVTSVNSPIYYGTTCSVQTSDVYNVDAIIVRTLYVELYDSAGIGYCRPMTDNDTQNGSSSRRWTRVFAVNTTISSSDERDKLDIDDSPLGLDFINDLRPVSYRWKVGEKKAIIDQEGKPILDADGNKTYEIREGVRKHYGLISQEVKQALDNSGVDDFAGWVQDDLSDPDSHQSISYEQFIAPLIKSVQELSAEVQTLKAKVAELEAK
jgi:hypothetical protein